MKQIGHAVLTVDLPGGTKEEFLITLPKLRIDGLWYGSPYIELTETSYIQSSRGWLSTVRGLLTHPLPYHTATPSDLGRLTADRIQRQGLLRRQVAPVQGDALAARLEQRASGV